MPKVGLTLRKIEIGRTLERELEVYFVAYAGADEEARGGHPLRASSDQILNVRRGHELEFDGLGKWLVQPVEIEGLACFRIEIWESDQGLRDIGAMLEKAKKSVHFGSPLVAALAAGSAGKAIAAILKIAGVVAGWLRNNQDDMLFEFDGFIDSSILINLAGNGNTWAVQGKKVRAHFGVIVTE